MGAHYGRHVEQHRLDDITVIVVEVERGAVAIPAVTLVPLHVAVEGILHGGHLTLARKLQKRSLDHS